MIASQQSEIEELKIKLENIALGKEAEGEESSDEQILLKNGKPKPPRIEGLILRRMHEL